MKHSVKNSKPSEKYVAATHNHQHNFSFLSAHYLLIAIFVYLFMEISNEEYFAFIRSLQMLMVAPRSNKL